ncbi:MAG: TldD/PmbA family protein [Chloroflexi bacterium]|nr:TldD/PmbA family protein [Chloroflexota bacterium]MCL5109473.1 TldD/PmbA family protein [Chloroflexota bacterium]
MIGREKAKEIAQRALEHSQADQTEVLLMGEDSGLTRFSNSYIHQNVAESNADLHVRVVFGKKIGVATTNDLSQGSIRRTVDEASRIARLQPENPDFVSLPGPKPASEGKGYSPATAEATPEDRAEVALLVCRRALQAGASAAGAFSTGTYELAVHNSLGVEAYAATTVADFSSVVTADDGSGYSAQVAVDWREIATESLAEEAVEGALRGRNATGLEPGEYEVVLSHYAVVDILDNLGYEGLGATPYQEDRSFMSGKLGQRLAGENVSLWDDGQDPTGLPLPFDYEGVPKQKVMFFNQGTAEGVAYDSYTAHKVGRQSTGHALPAPNPGGPLPLNMFMQAGDSSLDDLVRSLRHGLLVTRFWYTRTVHPITMHFTGMTRDGTFLVENGQIVRPVRNLRFTQSYLEALRNVEAISKETKLLRDQLGGCRVPAIKVKSWNFTGVSEL